MTYIKALEGPSITEGFTVQSGIVTVHGGGSHSIVLPAGASWPGLNHLPKHLDQLLMPTSSQHTSGASFTFEQLTERERALAVALIESQLLRQGLISQRIRRVPNASRTNQQTLAAILGCTRESVSKAINKNRKEQSYG